MKSERGVTLVSLIVYVIAMLITITIITVVTSYFYNNDIDVTAQKYTYYGEFTNIEGYFSEEANFTNNKIIEYKNINTSDNTSTQAYLALSSGNQYTYVKTNKALYKNNVKIASGIENCIFGEEIKNGNSLLTISVAIQGKDRQMQYVLK